MWTNQGGKRMACGAGNVVNNDAQSIGPAKQVKYQMTTNLNVFLAKLAPRLM